MVFIDCFSSESLSGGIRALACQTLDQEGMSLNREEAGVLSGVGA